MWNNKFSGQIALLFTLIIAVIFLFMSVTINIGRVAQRKTQLSNAVDATAILLASRLGSWAYYLSDTYLTDEGEELQAEKINFDWDLLGDLLTEFTTFLYSPGAGLLSGYFFLRKYLMDEPDKMDRENWNLEQMSKTANEGLEEMAISNVLQFIVDDPVTVIDVHDADDDGKIDDKVSRFYLWLLERSRWSKTTKEKYDQTLAEISNLFRPYFYNILKNFSKTFSSEENPNVRYRLEYILIPLFNELESCGYDVSFWKPGDSNDEVDDAIKEIDDFSQWATVLHLQSVNSLLNSMDIWQRELYFGDTASGDEPWYDTLKNRWQMGIAKWQKELELLYNQVYTCYLSNVSQECGIELDKDDPLLSQKLEECLGPNFKLRVVCDHCCCKVQPQKVAVLYNLQESHDIIRNLLTDTNQLMGEIGNLRDQLEKEKKPDIYSWKDSLGWHHIRVKVGRFSIPTIVNFRSGTWHTGARLLGQSGEVNITATRYDEDTPAFLGKDKSRLLWLFRYRKNLSESNIEPSSGIEYDKELELPIIDDNFKQYQEDCLNQGISSTATAEWSYKKKKAFLKK